MTPRRQRGVALLVALIVVALATLLIAALLDAGQLALARTRNQLRAAQAQAYARGMEAYAARVLQQDWADGQVDSSDDIWAVPMPPTPVPGGRISGTMHDLDGCFNLNNLVIGNQRNTLWMRRFQRLLLALKLPPSLADVVADWIDADAVPAERGAEDNYYLSQSVPYRAANRAFADVSELRLLAGVDAHTFAVLAPYVCALPAPSVLNLNTASPPVLMSLAQGVTLPLAQRLYRDGHAKWQSASGFFAELASTGIPTRPDQQTGLGVVSRDFQARALVEIDGLAFVYRIRLYRRRGLGVRVVARERGE